MANAEGKTNGPCLEAAGALAGHRGDHSAFQDLEEAQDDWRAECT